jgi:hypothetical protein
LEQARSGRVWAWLLLLLGGVVSMAVSIGHAHVQAASVGDGHGPAGSAVAWAVAWAVLVPVMLAAAVRAVTVIRWPQQRRWAVVRFCATVPVAALAGYMSWSHMSGLLLWLGEDWLVCVLAWLAVDGLMLLGTAGLLATRATTTGTTSRPLAEANGTRRSGPDVGLGLFEPAGRTRGGA